VKFKLLIVWICAACNVEVLMLKMESVDSYEILVMPPISHAVLVPKINICILHYTVSQCRKLRVETRVSSVFNLNCSV